MHVHIRCPVDVAVQFILVNVRRLQRETISTKKNITQQVKIREFLHKVEVCASHRRAIYFGAESWIANMWSVANGRDRISDSMHIHIPCYCHHYSFGLGVVVAQLIFFYLERRASATAFTVAIFLLHEHVKLILLLARNATWVGRYVTYTLDAIFTICNSNTVGFYCWMFCLLFV